MISIPFDRIPGRAAVIPDKNPSIVNVSVPRISPAAVSIDDLSDSMRLVPIETQSVLIRAVPKADIKFHAASTR